MSVLRFIMGLPKPKKSDHQADMGFKMNKTEPKATDVDPLVSKREKIYILLASIPLAALLIIWEDLIYVTWVIGLGVVLAVFVRLFLDRRG
jgi:hypothetical protein